MNPSGKHNAPFGKPPESFEETIDRALHTIMNESKANRRPRRGLAVAVALLTVALLAVTAMAAGSRLGLFDFWGENQKLPETAQDLVVQNPTVVMTNEPDGTPAPKDGVIRAGVVEVTVDEAVADGQRLHILFTARLAEGEQGILIGLDTSPDDSYANVRYPGKENDSTTFAQAARSAGVPLYHVDSYVMDEVYGFSDGASGDIHYHADGSVSIAWIGNYETDATVIDQELIMLLMQWNLDGPQNTREQIAETSVEVELPVTASQGTDVREIEIGQIVEGIGLRLDSIKMTKTELSIYYEIAFSEVGQTESGLTADEYAAIEGIRGDIWFELLNESGERFPDMLGSGEITPLADGSYLEKGTIDSSDGFPTNIELRAFDAFEKTRYGSVTVTVP